MTIAWAPFVALVRAHRRFLLTSHVRPDCDALGSELGMAGLLQALGKQVRIVNAQEIPPNLAFIDPQRQIAALGADVRAEELADAEVLIVLDTSAWAQLGTMADVLRTTAARKLVIDHHVSADDLGCELFKDTQAEATGTLVLQAAHALGVPLTPAIAIPLFAAIATDTGWFRFGSTRPETYRAAAELMEAGACPSTLYCQLYERDTLGRVRLRGLILSRTEAELAGRLVHTYVHAGDFPATGSLPSDTEDVINMTLTVAGAEVAVIVVEQLAGGCKVSFRSRGALDCSRLAERFRGGGHRAAAGAFIDRPLEEARAVVLEAVRQAMRGPAAAE